MFVNPSNTFTPEELHQFAMDSIVRCIPNSDIDEHYTLYKIYGPFRANIPCEMPLSMALQLKVNVEIPLYYQNLELDKLMRKEQQTQLLNKLPHEQFFEIGFTLKHNIKKLNDFRNVRLDKMMSLVNKMHPNFIQFGNPTLYECNMMRPLVMPLLAYLKYASPGDIGDLSAENVKRRFNERVSQIQEE